MYLWPTNIGLFCLVWKVFHQITVRMLPQLDVTRGSMCALCSLIKQMYRKGRNITAPGNSKIADAQAKMEKDKLPNFLFREALIFWHSFSSVIKDGPG